MPSWSPDSHPDVHRAPPARSPCGVRPLGNPGGGWGPRRGGEARSTGRLRPLEVVDAPREGGPPARIERLLRGRPGRSRCPAPRERRVGGVGGREACETASFPLSPPHPPPGKFFPPTGGVGRGFHRNYPVVEMEKGGCRVAQVS